VDFIYRYDPYQPITPTRPETSDEAIQKLSDGNLRFAGLVAQMQRVTMGEKIDDPIIFPVSPLSLGLPLFAGGVVTQAPFALCLGCSDARAPVEAIFDQAFNDIFTIRIAGNVLGTECLGSIDYAVRHFGQSLKLVVVLGHSGCGAVTAAVDTYLSPNDYAAIACTHSLRSLVDRIQLAVRGASKGLDRVTGGVDYSLPAYRNALIETAVYLNAALTAFDLRREILDLGMQDLEVVYGVYDLATLRIHSMPEKAQTTIGTHGPCFGRAPAHAEEFTELSTRLAESAVDHGFMA